MKRIGIYYCQSVNSTVQAYMLLLLKSLYKEMDYLVVVIDNDVNRDTLELLVDGSNDLFVLQGCKTASDAYRAAINYVGWETLREYDELILTDSEMVGSFQAIHKILNKLDIKTDFWGLYRVVANGADGQKVKGMFPHLWGFRKKAMKSQAFFEFWNANEEWDYAEDILQILGIRLMKKLQSSGLNAGFVFDALDPKASCYKRVSLLTEYEIPLFHIDDLRCVLGQDIGAAMKKRIVQPVFDATIVRCDIDTIFVPGRTVPFKVTVMNCGNQIWSEGEQFRLSIWLEGIDKGRVLFPDYVRVHPKEQFTFSSDTFILEDTRETVIAFQMCKENVCYFGEKKHILLSPMNSIKTSFSVGYDSEKREKIIPLKLHIWNKILQKFNK